MTFEKKISTAAALAAEYILEDALDGSLTEYEFSDEFKNTISRIGKNLEKKNRKDHKIVKRLLIAAAVIIITFAFLLVYSPEIRAAVSGWIQGLFGIYTTYKNEGGIKDFENRDYILGWIPDGYEQYELIQDEHGSRYNYQNDAGELLVFSYTFGDGSSELFIDPENARSETIMVNDCTGVIMMAEKTDESNMLIWMDQKNNVLFYISGFESRENLMTMAESVESK